MESIALLEYAIEDGPHEEELSPSVRQTIARSRASNDEEFLALVKKLDTFPRYIRTQIVTKMAGQELHSNVTGYLQDRAHSIPFLAKRYRVSEREV